MAAPDSRQIVVFSLGGEEFAFPIASVVEIIRHAEPRSVAAPSPSIRGVIGLRGKIIPVFDLASHLNLGADVDQNSKIVIVDAGSGQIGMMVDDVDEVLTIPADALEPLPVSSTSGVDAVARIGDRLVMVLDPSDVLQDVGDQALATF